ncbi:MAG TPA: CoA transferase [Terriglobia bacterium]|jgi:crotonobetainyl-CoA:carnitine CoA-transferase CaiB-like acyl-CoA transferase
MKPLEDLFVVDLSRILSGPVCTMLMADMGAEVIKIEPPPLGDDSRQWGPPFIGGISTYFLAVNRNKKSLGLNLKAEAGRRILWKLIERADVIVENFRPGVLDKLGFGYEAVAKANPRTVYCSISGFGQTGPYRERPGYDVIAQGESGMMDLTGFPDGPPAKLGASLADIVAGLYAFNGICLALLARHKTGKGQRVDVSLLDGMVSTLAYHALIYLSTGRSPRRAGTRHPSIVPYESFKVTDGFVNIAVTNQKQWENFCEVLGFPEMAHDARFESMKARLANYGELRPMINRVVSKMTRSEVMEAMSKVGIPAGPINTVAEILEDPHIRAREMVVELTHPEYGPLKMLGIPIKLSDTPGAAEKAPPKFGEHNLQVLRGLGYSDSEIEKLEKEGIATRGT